MKPVILHRDEATIRQIALMRALKRTTRDIAKELDISQATVTRISNTDECKRLIKDVLDSALMQARDDIKQDMMLLAREVSRVIKKKLEEDDLDTVKVVLGLLGFKDKEQASTQAQNITVVLPGANESNTIEVKQDETN